MNARTLGVVLSPTAMVPMSGLRTMRTLTRGIFRLTDNAANSPALPDPRTNRSLIIM